MIIRYKAKSNKRQGKYIELNIDGVLQHIKYTQDVNGILRCHQLLTIRHNYYTNEPYIALESHNKTLHAESVRQLVHRLVSVLLYTIVHKTRLPNTKVRAFNSGHDYGKWRVDVFKDTQKVAWLHDRLYYIRVCHYITSKGNAIATVFTFSDELRNDMKETSHLRRFGCDSCSGSFVDLYNSLLAIQRDYSPTDI